MKKELELVKQFHKKFKAPISESPILIPKKRGELRFKLIDEEVKEYLEGTKKEDIENIAKELCDILYSTYGTILEHGLQHIIEDIFEEVHNSHMTKEYSSSKMVKGENFIEADVSKFFKK